jgi:redox-sensitive bicupin YhaK (pirin superfamily)
VAGRLAGVGAFTLAVATAGPLEITAEEDSRFVLLGGAGVGRRFIDWNLVSSTQIGIYEAKAAWAPDPGSERFPKVPGDSEEFIPLPAAAPADYP